ncbi:MAG: DUF6932 family protein [Frankiaceae bacterium]
MLPDLTSDGLLPAGIHRATLEELRETFVDKAPYADERRVIFTGLELYLQVLRALVPRGVLWVDGGFVTHKDWAAPHDVDLALLIDRSLVADFSPEDWARLSQLLTLQGVTSEQPYVVTPRVQPMGGLIDAFVVEVTDVAGRRLWEEIWSQVTDQRKEVVQGKRKGFVEVEW